MDPKRNVQDFIDNLFTLGAHTGDSGSIIPNGHNYVKWLPL